jgi:hypothetical protein
MYPTVAIETYGVGVSSVDLMAGKEPSRRALMVRDLEGLMTIADMPWLPARAEKRWAKRTLKRTSTCSVVMVGRTWDGDGHIASDETEML